MTQNVCVLKEKDHFNQAWVKPSQNTRSALLLFHFFLPFYDFSNQIFITAESLKQFTWSAGDTKIDIRDVPFLQHKQKLTRMTLCACGEGFRWFWPRVTESGVSGGPPQGRVICQMAFSRFPGPDLSFARRSISIFSRRPGTCGRTGQSQKRGPVERGGRERCWENEGGGGLRGECERL